MLRNCKVQKRNNMGKCNVPDARHRSQNKNNVNTFPSIWLKISEKGQKQIAICGFYREWSKSGKQNIEEQVKSIEILTRQIDEIYSNPPRSLTSLYQLRDLSVTYMMMISKNVFYKLFGVMLMLITLN